MAKHQTAQFLVDLGSLRLTHVVYLIKGGLIHSLMIECLKCGQKWSKSWSLEDKWVLKNDLKCPVNCRSGKDPVQIPVYPLKDVPRIPGKGVPNG